MKADPYLRSAAEVIGYHIQATDDEIGHVEDNAYKGGAKNVINNLTVTYWYYRPYFYSPYYW